MKSFKLSREHQQQNLENISDAADRAAAQDHAVKLLDTVKNYRSTVLEASRQATIASAPAFPDEEPELAASQVLSDTNDIPAPKPIPPRAPDLPTPLRTSARASPFRPPSPPRISKISVLPTRLLGKLRTANAFLSQSSAPAPEPDFIEGQNFAIAVVHIPRDLSRNLYERLIYVKMGDQQLQIPDLELHVLEPHEVVVNDATLADAFILVGEFMRNPEKFQKTIADLEMEID
ncbi:hypothetical protein FRC09_014407 [Ceratobasidium sp. 395]|nr:hypothetical protein FRC09_014407 [Ceratobasidium sp. 395]